MSDPTMDGPAIAASGLAKRYGTREVLRGVDLVVPSGSVMGLLGTNGAGKSTLLRCLLGLAAPDAGEARVLGRDSRLLGEAEKERIGYVAQDPPIQRWMTAGHFAGYVAAFYPRWDTPLVERLLDAWSIPRDQPIDRLSPGQAQRLAIILALGHNPRLLVLDEPAASLDPMARRAFLGEILAVAGEEGRTVLLSTHLTSDLERVADSVAILKDGRIAFAGGIDELKDSVKRVRVQGPGLPPRFEQPWVVRCERDGDSALLTVRGDVAQAAEALRRDHGADIAIEDLNLEDIFVELHR